MRQEREPYNQQDPKARAGGILEGLPRRRDGQSIGDYVVNRLQRIDDDGTRSKTITALHRMAAGAPISSPNQQVVVENVLGVTMAITDYGVDPEVDKQLPKVIQVMGKKHVEIVSREEITEKTHRLQEAGHDIDQMYGQWLGISVLEQAPNPDVVSHTGFTLHDIHEGLDAERRAESYIKDETSRRLDADAIPGQTYLIFSLDASNNFGESRKKDIESEVSEELEPGRAIRLIALYDNISQLVSQHPTVIARALMEQVLTDEQRKIVLEKRAAILKAKEITDDMHLHDQTIEDFAQEYTLDEVASISAAGGYRLELVKALCDTSGITNTRNDSFDLLRDAMNKAALVITFDGKSIGIVDPEERPSLDTDQSLGEIDPFIDWDSDDGMDGPRRSL